VTFPDSELSSDPPQKRYMGVRVKMPVRELLRKIRLSKGLDPAPGKGEQDTSCLLPSPFFHPARLLLLFQGKQSTGQTPKGLEDLDILVEVLQEDLNKSQLREEPQHPAPGGFWQGFSTDLRSRRWESAGSQEAAGGLQGKEHSPAELHPESCWKEFQPLLRAQAQPSFHGERESIPRSGMFSGTGDKGSGWGRQDVLLSSQEELLPEARRGSPDVEGHLRLPPNSFTQQDLSALSFFQFQLHREENLLRNIPEEKLLAPDENGNRLLHKAVAQGRRALTFALAQRFASLNKIDEKDAEERTALHLAAEKNQHLMVSDLISLGANVNEQDRSGKTPLHLCAENGYLRVLQVNRVAQVPGLTLPRVSHAGFTALQRAALAHAVLGTESRSAAGDSSAGRLLRLREEQIREGILCLLQM
ncbi:IKBZ inhibitor, partial [Cinclus mexicanus]|nr:IKBZ inhibitor [Cinclus mexicanus]